MIVHQYAILSIKEGGKEAITHRRVQVLSHFLDPLSETPMHSLRFQIGLPTKQTRVETGASARSSLLTVQLPAAIMMDDDEHQLRREIRDRRNILIRVYSNIPRRIYLDIVLGIGACMKSS